MTHVTPESLMLLKHGKASFLHLPDKDISKAVDIRKKERTTGISVIHEDNKDLELCLT